MGKTSGWPSVHSVLFSLRLVAVFFIFLFILTGWHSGESLSTPLPKNRHRLFSQGGRGKRSKAMPAAKNSALVQEGKSFERASVALGAVRYRCKTCPNQHENGLNEGKALRIFSYYTLSKIGSGSIVVASAIMFA